ncbi:MAG: class I SAM-dependent methyltransferase [Sulfuricaulis sp.]|uniref:class I SAM-dependent methyltransferase n=1 Tax=Sulfuricaulis sp. TaxID=2003553 RepID=UPI003C434483
MKSHDEKAPREHWERVWEVDTRDVLPSWFDVGSRNLQRILRRHVAPGMRYLEIGCAPGRLLAWVALRLGAEVAGLDYSAVGLAAAQRLFQGAGIVADLRCENVFTNSFEPGSFDIVSSFGLIEHFDDPRPVVDEHVKLVRPGGVAMIVVPNYRGIYGRLQRHFDPENLRIHNLNIMSCEQLLKLVPTGEIAEAQAYSSGRVAPGLISFARQWPSVLAKAAERMINVVGSIQPFEIPMISPLLVLQVRRTTSMT